MNIWIITIGEPILIDGSDVRLLRSGILCNKLLDNNCKVVFFNSTFNHVSKKHRFLKNTIIKYTSQLDFILLKSIGYKKNISLSRLIDHFFLARNFKKKIQNIEKPDLIFCSMPTIELSYFAVRYGKKNNIPVIIDVRDLWPDIFHMNTTNIFKKKLLQIIFYPSQIKLKYIFSNCTSIVAITNSFLNWAESKTEKSLYLKNDYFFLSNDNHILSEVDRNTAKLFWDNLGITNNKSDFNICLFASFGNVIDLETILKTSEILNQTNFNVRFIICGIGLRYEYYKTITNTNSNIVFPGWVNKFQIVELMQRSHFGILPYKNYFDFKMSIPNKVFEYFSQGLPILTCLRGEVEILINKFKCGVMFNEGDYLDLAKKIILQKENYNEINYKQICTEVYNSNFHPVKIYNNLYNHIIEIKKLHDEFK
jgi:glycosyltransferase involved in cell wall biosynthesis